MKAKKTVYIFLLSISSVIMVFFSALYVYDPLQLFHKHWIGKKNTLISNMRQQVAGIINNYKFDSIILGTSMLANTSAKEASEKLGGDFINISIDGSNYYERSLVLKYALSRHSIQKVLFSLDDSLGGNKLVGHKVYTIDTFDYLYDDNALNDINAYINNKYLKCLLNFSDTRECIGIERDFDRPSAWYKSIFHSCRFGGLENWFKAKNSGQIKAAFKSISGTAKYVKNGKSRPVKNIEKNIIQSKKYIDITIMEYVKNYPCTEFILILPPYSRIKYAQWAQYNKPTFEIYKSMIYYLVEKSSEFENLKIFGWGNNSFVDDIANYKDTGHYEYIINSWMLDAINRNEGLLTKSNTDDYLDLFTQKALDFDLIGLGEKIDNYLNNNN